MAEWINALKQEGVKSALDTVGMAMKIGVAAGPTVIKPNVAELSELFETELPSLESVVAAARKLVANGVSYVVVSMGEEGAMFVTADQVLHARGVEVPRRRGRRNPFCKRRKEEEAAL